MAEFTEVLKQKERMCEYFTNPDKSSCRKCPMASVNNGYDAICETFLLNHPQEAEPIIMKWAKENPIKTNADKFKEVFGVKIRNASLKGCSGIDTDCSISCADCKYKDFWNQEYTEPKGAEE